MAKERPIIFNTEMVKAILDNRKTMTRRVIKPQPSCAKMEIYDSWEYKNWLNIPKKDEGRVWIPTSNSGKVGIFEKNYYKCPYGKIGQNLWVRETYSYGCYDFGTNRLTIHYKADGLDHEGHKWFPSIFMPRKYSRIDLEITDIRVERVQNISRDDCIAEDVPQTYGEFKGLAPEWASKDKNDASYFYDNRTSRENFYLLWDSINAKRKGCSWIDNPWCWVICFEKEGVNGKI